VCSNHQRVGELGRPCLLRTQEIGDSNPPALTNCPRSSADQSGRLLSGGSDVQVIPRAPGPLRMVGRAARQRGANASRPFGVGQVRLLHHPPARALLNGRAAAFQANDASSILAVRANSPRSSSGLRCRSFKSDDAGSNPARGSKMLPLRLAGRAPGFELGGLGSNPRGAARFTSLKANARNSSVVERRSHTPRQPQVRSLLPRPGFAGLAKWEGNGSWPRHEAVRSRQLVPGV
jgi:hypothetical protein